MTKGKESQAEKIVRLLHSGERQDLVILIIPSHDKKNDKINDQEMWAHAALELFANLYGGATGFETFAGVFKSADTTILRDKPILIECYASRTDVENVDKLNELLKFIRRMGRDTEQEAVGLIVNDVFHTITEFKRTV